MSKRMFPIGMQTFSDIRARGAIYIDKSALIYKLVTEGKVYFLSRPRRFGKSLLISTLEAYFKGQKELFSGLAIEKLENEWIKYPVFRFDFSYKKSATPEGLSNLMDNLLSEYEARYTVPKAPVNDYALRLKNLITTAHEQTGQQVVILIDEYDAPLLDTMADAATFKTLRTMMRDFYSPLKAADAHLKFIFLSGITKFSQLSIFSELNNLKNISMKDEYAALCGITKEELKTALQPEVAEMAAKLQISSEETYELLKNMYDGYHFSKNSPDIFNPFSLLNALQDKDLNHYWYSTGTPTHLTEMVSKYTLRPEDLEGFLAGEMDFNVPFEGAETPIPALYQSGYLTIKKFDGYDYILGFPNEEVRVSFLKGLMPYYTKKTASENNSVIQRSLRFLRNHDIDSALTLLRSFFSSIPYNAERQDEAHYKTIFYLIFTLASEYSVRTEECTAAGRSDALIETEDTIYLFEFKLSGTAEEALKQIDDKGYAIKYAAGEKKVVKIGVNFDKEKRTIERWVIG